MRHSIKLRLVAAFIGLAVGPLLAAGILVAWQSYNTQRSQAVAFQREVGQRIADQTTALIDKAEAQLIVVSNDANVFPVAGAGHDLILLSAVLSSNRMFEELALVDPNGLVLTHISTRAQSTPEQLSDRFQADGILIPSFGDPAYYGPVRFAENTGEPSMTIAVPLVDKRTGVVDGFVVGIVLLKVVWEFIDLMRVGERGIAYIIDGQNRVIAHRNPSVVLRGTEFYPPNQDGFGRGLDGNSAVISKQKLFIGSQRFHLIRRYFGECELVHSKVPYVLLSTCVAN